MKLKEKINLWSEKYVEVRRWLAKIQQKEQNAFDLYRFCEWSGKDPVELLALKDDPASKEAERLLDDFVADEKKGVTNAVKFRMVSAVKSFFKHSYRDLARASGAMMLEKVKPYNKPRKEELRKLWNWALNPRDKSLLTFVCSTAIAKGTLPQLKWKHLEENWEKAELPCIHIPGKLLKGRGLGRYKGVKQITFLTPEAKRDLINYKEWIEAKLERKLTPEDHIFLETYGPYEPIRYGRLGTLIWRLSRVSHVPFSWHDARRYVNTAMEEIRMPPNWARKIRGRKVRGEEAPYSLPAISQLRKKFKEAVPLLEFTSEKPAVTKQEIEKIAKKEVLIATAKSMGMTDKEIRSVFRMRKASLIDEEINALEEKIREKANADKNSEDCPDVENCREEFKQIGETELLSYLKEGWRVVHRLASGEFIVKR